MSSVDEVAYGRRVEAERASERVRGITEDLEVNYPARIAMVEAQIGRLNELVARASDPMVAMKLRTEAGAWEVKRLGWVANLDYLRSELASAKKADRALVSTAAKVAARVRDMRASGRRDALADELAQLDRRVVQIENEVTRFRGLAADAPVPAEAQEYGRLAAESVLLLSKTKDRRAHLADELSKETAHVAG